MIANSAFLAGLVTLALGLLALQETIYFAPYRRLFFVDDLWTILAAVLAVFFNLFASCYALSRWLFLKDTGRKLAHVEKQLLTPDTVVHDLSERLLDGDDD